MKQRLEITVLRLGGALGVAIAMLASGCGSSFGEQKIPQFAVCGGPSGASCTAWTPSTTTFKLSQPSKAEQATYFDVQVTNTGKVDTEVLDIYLAAGSNKYVSLVWSTNDPFGEGLYTSGEPVKSCPPDTSAVRDPTILPQPRDVADPCSFPMSLPADPQLGRKVRLVYQFDPLTQDPDPSPVVLVFQFDWQEDPIAPDGVIKMEIPVEACTGQIVLDRNEITFEGASPTNPITETLCITNEGCGDLTLGKIYLKNTQTIEEFTIRNAPPEGTVVPSKADDPTAKVCFDVRYLPQDNNYNDFNKLVVESSDPDQGAIEVPLSAQAACPVDYGITHDDLEQDGKPYLDFTGVTYPDTAQKTIVVTNHTEQCPITIDAVKFDNAAALQSVGGGFWAEVFKDGQSVGQIGKIGGQALGPVVLAHAEQAASIVVHYEPPEVETDVPSKITLTIKTGAHSFEDEAIPIMVGEPKGKLVLAPSDQPTQSLGCFAASQGQSVVRTFALFNEGLAPLTVTEVTLDNGFGVVPQDFVLVDDGEHVVGGVFQQTTLPPLSVVPLAVAYEPTSGATKVQGFANIWTEDHPNEGENPTTPYQLILQGRTDLTDQYTLPTANPGSAEDYAGAKVGQKVTLNAYASDPGDFQVLDTGGYVWWMTQKPEGSVVALNEVGGPTVSFTPDQPGTYRVHLVLVGTLQGLDACVQSAEATVDIDVAPAQ